MQQVYSPANLAEAHMLAHLLEREGFPAHVHGKSLQAAVGELPAGNLLQILVADEHYDAARKLLLAWDQEQVTPDPVAVGGFAWKTAIAFVVIGALIGFGAGYGYSRSSLTFADGAAISDHNNDGRTDNTYYYRVGASSPHKLEADTDFDGRTDLIVLYDETGLPRDQRSDNDFDGVLETHTLFRLGNAASSEIDSDDDGAPDIFMTFNRGVLSREEIHDVAAGVVARVNIYEGDRLARAEVDLNRDGFAETLRTFDRYGEVARTETRQRP